MGLFYTQQTSIARAAHPILTAARTAAPLPAAEAKAAAQNDAEAVAQAARPEFSVSRFICAAVLVVLLAALWIYVAHDAAMKDAASAMQNLLVTLTSGLIGVLVGEASGASS
jgi:hypothetical protein